MEEGTQNFDKHTGQAVIQRNFFSYDISSFGSPRLDFHNKEKFLSLWIWQEVRVKVRKNGSRAKSQCRIGKGNSVLGFIPFALAVLRAAVNQIILSSIIGRHGFLPLRGKSLKICDAECVKIST